MSGRADIVLWISAVACSSVTDGKRRERTRGHPEATRRRMTASPTSNPLVRRDPELVARLAALRERVRELMLDQLAADLLHDSAFRSANRPHAREDVRSVLLVLRVLTKPEWDDDDRRVLDACWREASHSDLFAEEFEAERHRIRHCIEDARSPHRLP